MALRVPPASIAWHVGASLVAVGVAAWSLTTFVNNYEHGICILDKISLDFLLPPVLFSVCLIWLFSEALVVTSAGVLERPLGRPQALLLGTLVHFSIGTIGFLTFANVGYRGAVEWIPLWIIGLMYAVGHFGVCH
jgi:hypothetical protein